MFTHFSYYVLPARGYIPLLALFSGEPHAASYSYDIDKAADQPTALSIRALQLHTVSLTLSSIQKKIEVSAITYRITWAVLRFILSLKLFRRRMGKFIEVWRKMCATRWRCGDLCPPRPTDGIWRHAELSDKGESFM